MEHEFKNIEPFKLLQPDLLTINELLSILKSRCVKADWSSLSKETLVELFKRVALPLPQREYPETVRGKKLTKLRRKFENTVKFEDAIENNVKTYTIGVNGHSVKPIIKERLKPPPCLAHQASSSGGTIIVSTESAKSTNVEHRRIKISFSDTTSQLDKIRVNDKKQNSIIPKKNKLDLKQNESNSTENSIVCTMEKLDKIVINDYKKRKLDRSKINESDLKQNESSSENSIVCASEKVDEIIINDNKKRKLDIAIISEPEIKQNESSSTKNEILCELDALKTKKVILKRSHLILQVENAKNNVAPSEVAEKKRKTITWP